MVTNSWTGDAARLAGEPAWILIDRFSEAAYLEAATRLRRVLEKQPAARTAARELAQREFSLDMAVDRYEQIYREVLSARS